MQNTRIFLELEEKSWGKEDMRAFEIYSTALWMPWKSISERREQFLEWSIILPNESPGLSDCHGSKSF